MKSTKEISESIVEEFQFLDDWMAKYEYIIDLGKSLAPMPEALHTEENLIKGCQSRVWLSAEYTNGKIHFLADSDAIMTKGMVSLLLRVFDQQSPDDILQADLGFIDEIGLKENLSPTRANGLISMINQMKHYALAYKAKHKI